MLKLLKILNLIFILITIGFSLFTFSLPFSVSKIRVEVLDFLKEPEIEFANNSLILFFKFKIINEGFYPIQNLIINVSLLTSNNTLITRAFKGYPYENITIEPFSEYIGRLSIVFNFDELNYLKIIENILKNKEIIVKIYVSGIYAYNFYNFEVVIDRKIKIDPPIEKLDVYFDIKNIFEIKQAEIKDNLIYIIFPISVFYKGWVKLTNITVNGKIFEENNIIGNFESKIIELNSGINNTVDVLLITSLDKFLSLIVNNKELFVQLKIIKDNLTLERSYKYFWLAPLNFYLNQAGIERINETHVNFLMIFTVINNLKNELLFKGKLKIYENNYNILLKEENLEFNLKPNVENIFNLNIILKNIDHRSVIRFDFTLIYPINLENYIIYSKIFVVP